MSGACTLVAGSSFLVGVMSEGTIERLVETIRSRRSESGEKSYTKQLLDGGPERCAKKLGEEAVETVMAAVSGDPQSLKTEAADLVYHLLVLLECRGVAWQEVLAVLDKRSGLSGLDEKAARAGR